MAARPYVSPSLSREESSLMEYLQKPPDAGPTDGLSNVPVLTRIGVNKKISVRRPKSMRSNNGADGRTLKHCSDNLSKNSGSGR